MVDWAGSGPAVLVRPGESLADAKAREEREKCVRDGYDHDALARATEIAMGCRCSWVPQTYFLGVMWQRGTMPDCPRHGTAANTLNALDETVPAASADELASAHASRLGARALLLDAGCRCKLAYADALSRGWTVIGQDESCPVHGVVAEPADAPEPVEAPPVAHGPVMPARPLDIELRVLGVLLTMHGVRNLTVPDIAELLNMPAIAVAQAVDNLVGGGGVCRLDLGNSQPWRVIALDRDFADDLSNIARDWKVPEWAGFRGESA